MVGLQWLSLARLLMASQAEAEAAAALSAAREILTVTHGGDHVIFIDVNKLSEALEESKKEQEAASQAPAAAAP